MNACSQSLSFSLCMPLMPLLHDAMRVQRRYAARLLKNQQRESHRLEKKNSALTEAYLERVKAGDFDPFTDEDGSGRTTTTKKKARGRRGGVEGRGPRGEQGRRRR